MIKIIYTLFLGLLLALFVGMGINVFYPGPKAPEYPSSLDSPRAAPVATTPIVEMPEQKQIWQQYDADFKQYTEQNKLHNRNVSLIALVCAILLLTLSLLFVKQLSVISDGVLLGGVFLTLYSLIAVFASDNTKYQFIVVSVGLLIALALGYIKFIRPTAEAHAAKA